MKKENCETKTPFQINYVLVGILAAAIAWAGYITLEKQKVIKEKEVQYVTLTVEKDSLITEKDSVLSKLKAAEETIEKLESISLGDRFEIKKLKKEIRDILYKTDITQKELEKANALVDELKNTITNAIAENELLKSDNLKLVEEKVQLVEVNNQLSKVLDSTKEEKKKTDNLVELGSSLNVGDVIISGINSKGKSTDVTEKVVKLRLSFTVNTNRISSSGNKTFHFVFYNTKGVVIGNHGTVTTTDGELVCIGEKTIEYKTGETPKVVYDILINNITIPGVYKVSIYESGKLSGKGSIELKEKKILGFL